MNKRDFMDIRYNGFCRVACIIPKVYLANPMANANSHLKELEKAYEQGVEYALCPELGLTGYSCGDLFHNQTLLNEASYALRELLRVTDTAKMNGMIISVGMPLQIQGTVFNVAVTFQSGKILAIHPKAYPPEYREFYELRHFGRAAECLVKEIELFDQIVPVGTDIIIQNSSIGNSYDVNPTGFFALHVEICEDGWVSIPPSTKAALAGATVLANMSASNITIGKSDYRRQLMLASSGANVAVRMYCAAGHGESTSDVAWDGDAIITERGSLLKTSERFQLDGTQIVCDVDLLALQQDRIRQNSFRENASDFNFPFRRVTCEAPENFTASYSELMREVDSHPFVPSDPIQRNERCYETFNIQAAGLITRLEKLPPHLRRAVIGISGGQDSTHALNAAVYAFDKLGLPRTDIIAITMPGFGTTKRTKKNAKKLCLALGVTFKDIPIKKVAKAIFAAIGHDETETSLVFENTQAWSRKVVELATASKFGGIVLGTGDLSELILGWCTMFGDHASHYGINSGVPKTLISFLIKWTADEIFASDKKVQKVLYDILDTPISPELLPPDGETITQVTEDKIGPYELHDFFSYYFLRFGYNPTRIARLAVSAFGEDRLPEIRQWMEVFLKRLFDNQFKRNCLPDGPKVGLICVSPRGDWRMPSDAMVNAWLREWEQIPDDETI